MKRLLDSHTLIWFYEGNPLLSARARAEIEMSNLSFFVSPASFWEIAIKVSSGKLQLLEPYDDFIQHAIVDNGFEIIPIEPQHTSRVITLPYHHRDPFDRILVAQALVEGFEVIGRDPFFDLYGVPRIW